MTPSLLLGTLPFILEGQEFTDAPNGTLDATTFNVLADPTDWRIQLDDLGIVKGGKLPISFGFHSMWVQDFKLSNLTPTSATIAVSCLGLLEDSEKRKTTVSATAPRTSIGPDSKPSGPITDMDGNIIEQNIDGTKIVNSDGVLVWRQEFPSAFFGGETATSAPAWSIANPKITLTSTYFTTTQPDPSVAGTEAASIPLDIETPTSPFGAGLWEYLNFRLNAPNGWVYDSRNIDPLFTDTLNDTGLWAVVDTITHYHGAEPM